MPSTRPFVRRPAAAALRAVLSLSLGCGGYALPIVAAMLPVQAVHAQAVQAQATGQVVRINAGAGKIAIRHGAIGKLDLPAMTLVYRVDPALLKGIAVGDPVSFTAERAGGQYRITELKKD